jgi:peptide/nickel transport system substrate-binding protein
MKKTVWTIVSCLMALALIIPSVAVAKKVASKTPKHGGTLITVRADEPRGMDPALNDKSHTTIIHPVTNKLITGDWWKGPAGTNEWPWDMAGPPPDNLWKGMLIESWETRTLAHYILHVRKGIMWQGKEGIMAAREFIADDVVFNFKRNTSTETHAFAKHKYKPTSVIALDKYTVELKLAEPSATGFYWLTNMYRLIPPEVVEKFGAMKDWKHVTGTGPFELVEYIKGSSYTYKKNPNYWEKDPEGRRLPYLDKWRVLIIPDKSTRISALRTGKIDMLQVQRVDHVSLQKTNPELQLHRALNGYQTRIGLMCNSRPFGPTMDKNAKLVRRAACLAVDHQALIRGFYKGEAKIIPFVIPPMYKDMYTALEDLPESARELFGYNPEKAKKLLAEAGYPNGVKVTLETYSGTMPGAEYMPIIKHYWDAVGIKTELKVHEPAAFWAAMYGFKTKDAIFNGYGFGPSTGGWYTTPEGKPYATNWAMVNDPHINETVNKINSETDYKKRAKLYKDLGNYIMDQAYELVLPTPYLFSYWSPWVGGYHGERYLTTYVPTGFQQYLWVDQEVKKSYGK